MNRIARNMLLAGIGICLAGMAGCRPKGVLSSREMRDVLYDLHRADGAIQVAGYNYSHDEELAAYYKSVLDKHGITQAQFDSSLVWYTDNPQRFNKIYPKVVARLEADLKQEQDLRDKICTEGTLSSAGTMNTTEQQEKRPLKPYNQLLHEYIRGLDTHWDIWKPAPFSEEKDIIIFGSQYAGTKNDYDSVCI